MGALRFLVEDEPPDPESRLEARQLKVLVFRENADSLYAQEQSSTGVRQQLIDIQVPDFDLDGLSLDQATGFLQFFNHSTPRVLDTDIPFLSQDIIVNDQQMTMNTSLSSLSTSINSPETRNVADTGIDKSELRNAMAKLPVCSRCKNRRTKCDVNLPACQGCVKSGHDCYYWDHVIGKDISRRYEGSTIPLNMSNPADSVTREIHTMKRKISQALRTDDIPPLPCGSNSIPEPAPLGIADFVATEANFAHRDLSSNLLCTSPYSSAKSIDATFFGASSIYSRFISRYSALSLLPDESSKIPSPSEPPFLRNISRTLGLDQNVMIPPTEAQNLVWYYYQSVEVIYPILGPDLIQSTINVAYDSGMEPGDKALAGLRLNLMIAISLILISPKDRRLQVISEAYFRQAISNWLDPDLFAYPAIESLQILLLLCIYVWLCPNITDIWRLLGHATRMCLDVIEVHGSGRESSPDAKTLYQSLYTLGTQISVYFGRPHQLPDRPESVSLETSSSGVKSDFASMSYSLAQIQNRLYRGMTGNRQSTSSNSSVYTEFEWITICVQDIQQWLLDWNSLIDCITDLSSYREEQNQTKISLRYYGELQQGETLLLAKLTADHHGHALASFQDNSFCMQILNAAYGLYHIFNATVRDVSTCVPRLVFSMTWTCTHAIFNSIDVILHDSPENGATYEDVSLWMQRSIEMLKFFDDGMQLRTACLVGYLQTVFRSKYPIAESHETSQFYQT
ncbi:fungal-specific transcription factor domain-containing protein [Penicillium angulare]|uniref:Fungal-specific transcription factor domain-containing protein n=1 Tax=Penicillium angulare TaxID=116970 RepID=A0A9W9FHJ4_9EURO|nr:fungal-specific transcription factor domain-containing protein [Penicillium angulare]